MPQNHSRRLRAVSSHVLEAEPCLGPGDERVPAAATIPLSEEDMVRLQAKYDFERDKRLGHRPQGNEQYTNIADLAHGDERFSRMLADPYPKVNTVHPVTDDVEVCVIGAG